MTVRAALIRGFDKRRLRLLLALFFLALAVPAAVLILEAFSQLKWEAVHRHRELAAELTARIDSELTAVIDAEEARSFADYGFLVVSGDPASSFVQRSPLSAYPVASPIPGLIGYFQIDAEGEFTTPLIPETGVAPVSYGIPPAEFAQRLELNNRIHDVLVDNRLIGPRAVAGEAAPARPAATPPEASSEADVVAAVASRASEAPARNEPVPESATATAGASTDRDRAVNLNQAAFDRLELEDEKLAKRKEEKSQSLGRLDDLALDRSLEEAAVEQRRQRPNLRESERPEGRGTRKEQVYLPAPQAGAAPAVAEPTAQPGGQLEVPIRAFESEIDPLAFGLLDSGHLVLFRKVWREGQRYIQGALIAHEPFVRGLIEDPFRATSLAAMSDLIVAHGGGVLSAFRAGADGSYGAAETDLAGTVLYRSALAAPLSAIELVFTVTRLPSGPGAALITWVGVILGAVLIGGCLLLYRLGVGQIELARQQQDFVSAVSHELKTPLTSIRMYGEMLREGWADEAKKRTYYDFIFTESERLSRLIANVLQLARMTRNEAEPDLKSVTVGEALDLVRSKVSSQVERAGFTLTVEAADEVTGRVLEIDPDGFAQVFINLIDNALKFAAKAERREIDLTVAPRRGGAIAFAVRDHGPGVPKGQLKKIFQLFYRSESELTRETVGTGIGLALVNQLVQSMGGKVDARNVNPGAEFQITLPAAPAGTERAPEATDRTAL